MIFDFQIYYRALVNNPLLFVVFGVLTLVWGILVYKYPILMSKFRLRRKPYGKDNKLYLYWTIICFVALSVLGLSFINTKLIFEKEEDSIEITGFITNIESVGRTMKMSYNGIKAHPDYITIGGEQYYIMYIGDFEIGDSVEITYLPKSKIVLEIYEFIEE